MYRLKIKPHSGFTLSKLARLSKLVVIAVQYSRNRSDFFRKQSEVEFRIALLHHAAQKPRCADPTLGTVDGSSIPAHLSLMAGEALMLRHELRTQDKISASKLLGQVLGRHREANAKPNNGPQRDPYSRKELTQAGTRFGLQLTCRHPESMRPVSWRQHPRARLGQALGRAPTCRNHQP